MTLLETLWLRLVPASLWLAMAAPIVQALTWLVRPSSPKTHRIAWAAVLLTGIALVRIPINVTDARPNSIAVNQSDAVVNPPSNGAPASWMSIFDAQPYVPHDSPAVAPPASMKRVAAPQAGARIESQLERIPVRVSQPTGPADLRRMAILTWAIGSAALLVLGALSYIRFARRVRRLEPAPDEWTAPWDELLAERGISRQIPFLASPSDGPAMCLLPWGYRLIVPDFLWGPLSQAERLAILRHELAHYERRDLYTSLAARLVVALHWFNPAAWWAQRQFEAAGEWACDDHAAERDGHVEFAKTLLQVAGVRFRSVPLADAAGTGPLHVRIHRLLTTASLADGRWKKSLLTGVSVSIVILASVRVNRVAEATSAEPSPTIGPSGADTGTSSNAGKPASAESTTETPRVDQLGDPLPAGALLRLGTLRLQHPRVVQDMALSPDEKTIVTLGGSMIAWDTATGKKRWEANAHDLGYLTNGPRYGDRGLAFTADGKWFYTPRNQNDVTAWDVSNGQHRVLSIQPPNRHPLPRPANVPNFIVQCRSVDVAPDEKRIAVGNSEGVVVCDPLGKLLYAIENTPSGPVDADKRDRLAMLGGHYSSGQFSPDGKMLAVVTSDKPQVVKLYDAATGTKLRVVALDKRLVRLAFSPDSKRIATTERDNAIRLYDAVTAKRVWSHIVTLNNPRENYTSTVAFSPDGKTVAAGATDQLIYLCDAGTGAEVGRLLGHHWYPWCLAFTADGKTLYSAGWDGTIRRWDVAARKQLAPPKGTRATEVVAASPDGQRIAYVDDLGIVHIVATKDGSDRLTLELPDMSFSQLAFSPDGGRLAAGGAGARDVRAVLWDARSGELLRRWDWPLGRDPHSTVEALGFSQDGQRLAAAVFRQSAAYVWDATSGEKLAQLSHNGIYGLAFSPDGSTLATAGWDSIVRLWGTDKWEMRRKVDVDDQKQKNPQRVPRFPDVDPRMYAVCWSPDGDWLATAHMDGNVRIWNAADMLPRRMFQVPGRFIYGALSISPDGLWLAAGGMTGEITLWDPASGLKVWDVGRQQGYAYTVGFGRDSRTLVSGGDDHVCYLWDLRPPQKEAGKDETALWDALIGTNGQAAYQAMWALSETPARAVTVISERAASLNHPLADLKGAQAPVAVRRVVSLLAQIGTVDAIRLLKQWAQRNPNGTLGHSAATALKRL